LVEGLAEDGSRMWLDRQAGGVLIAVVAVAAAPVGRQPTSPVWPNWKQNAGMWNAMAVGSWRQARVIGEPPVPSIKGEKVLLMLWSSLPVRIASLSITNGRWRTVS
jgi:hypothetical protein